jgi:1-deoxy-D-xylulose-5-phosphate synthase
VLDMVLLSKVPGMTIFAPSSYQELQGMLHDALDLCDGPAAIRWPGGAAPIVGEHEVGHGFRARKVREGDDVCLVGVGKLLEACVGAADLLAAEGIEATVWDPRVVKPLDPELLDDAARFAAVVTAEDGLRVGGAGTALADALAERATVGAPNPVVRTLGIPDAYVPQGKPDEILADLGLDANGIAASVRHLLTR